MPATLHQIEYAPLGKLAPNPKNPRVHSRKQRRQIARSIQLFGFTNPILVNESYGIIAGHGRYETAVELGLKSVPVIRVTGLSETEQRGLMVADNKLADNSSWDPDRLAEVLSGLAEIDFEVENLGFDAAELDKVLNHVGDGSVVDEADAIEEPDRRRPAISRRGDTFTIAGRHRLGCHDATDPAIYHALLARELVQAVIADVPYNVATQGHISKRNRGEHPSFAMAGGEMSEEEFTSFLGSVFALACSHSADGSLHYIFIDWRHLFELLTAGRRCYELKNLCIWAKDNGGLGSFYRSRHELIAVFKNGTAPHVNNIELGRHGRNRTNVWEYPGASTMRRGRLADLKDHPTVKPVAMIADAILDCTRPGDTVLDPFLGSGTTILAAERTGLVAVHDESGLTFDKLAASRRAGNER
ncbi:site-specific DNA-methyltransferase [uncultured Enterovirga sp.]|uniref:site-specific DNA-methyltransferase n=1 Tax=uncultured Enterovirga sp. TaxID=2026352 RepID=UPI0035CC7DA7